MTNLPPDQDSVELVIVQWTLVVRMLQMTATMILCQSVVGDGYTKNQLKMKSLMVATSQIETFDAATLNDRVLEIGRKAGLFHDELLFLVLNFAVSNNVNARKLLEYVQSTLSEPEATEPVQEVDQTVNVPGNSGEDCAAIASESQAGLVNHLALHILDTVKWNRIQKILQLTKPTRKRPASTDPVETYVGEYKDGSIFCLDIVMAETGPYIDAMLIKNEDVISAHEPHREILDQYEFKDPHSKETYTAVIIRPKEH